MNTQVAIIGGGPCGLMSALLLARYGVRSVLFEKHPDIGFHPKAMGVTRRTGELYRQLGILSQMESADLKGGYDALSVWSRGFDGEIWGKVPLTDQRTPHTPCHRFHCPQPHTEAVLREAAQAEELTTVLYNHEVVTVRPGEDGVALDFVERGSGKAGTLRADWLIAADGDRSGVREQLGITRTGPGERGRFLSVYFRANYGDYLEGRRAVLYQLLGEDFFEFIVAVNGADLWLMHHFLQEGEKPEDYSKERLRDIITYVSGLPEEPVEIFSVSPWVMAPKLADRWRAGRVFLTGDASARVSPSGGLGMNNGLQSAHNLAWKLAAVIHGQSGEALLDTYEVERLAAARFTLENSEGNADELMGIIGTAFAGDWDGVREKIAHSRRGGSGLGQDIGLTYSGEAVLDDGTKPAPVADPVNDYVPQGRPGHRAPHVEVSGAGDASSTLDFFGRGFVLLCGPDGATCWREMAQAESQPLTILALGEDFQDGAGAFLERYGIGAEGAVLVRPDGYIAARWRSNPGQAHALSGALDKILARCQAVPE